MLRMMDEGGVGCTLFTGRVRRRPAPSSERLWRPPSPPEGEKEANYTAMDL